jgi:glyoxylase I family protein
MTQAAAQPDNTDYRAGMVRYLVGDVDKAVAFYTEHLRFRLVQQRGPVAILANDPLRLLLSGPGSSGARSLPDGAPQEPGGSNRILLEVTDLDARITELQQQGVTFRNAMEVGPGGKQIQVQDPDGNPIELFEPAETLP